MNGKEIFINLKNGKVYLTKDKTIPISDTNLPVWISNYKRNVALKIRIISNIFNEKRILVEILQYLSNEVDINANRDLSLGGLVRLEKVDFKSIDTMELLKIYNGAPNNVYTPTAEHAPLRNEEKANPNYIHTSIKRILKDSISMKIENIIFHDGYITFNYNYKNTNIGSEIKIENEYVKKEFNAIKNYIVNHFKSKTVSVDLNLELEDDNIISYLAKSNDINKINAQLIDQIKIELVNRIIRSTENTNSNIVIYSLKNLVQLAANLNIDEEIFFKNEISFFNDLLSISGTKHFQHLSYLSKLHSQSIGRLRFTINPFAFVFMTETKNSIYLIWETLNTEEATYIWELSEDKSTIDNILCMCEEKIKHIKRTGKSNYINQKEIGFRRVFHDYQNKTDGFNIWKKEIEEILRINLIS